MTHTDYEWHELLFPVQLLVEPVSHFLRSLASRPRRGPFMQSRPVVVEAIGASHGLHWRLGVHAKESTAVLRLLHAQLPDVRHQPSEPQREAPNRAWELRTSSQRRPLRTDVPEVAIATVLGALHAAGTGERVILQLLIGPWLPRHPVQVQTSLGQRGPLPNWNDWLVTSEQATALRTKQQEPLFGVTVRVGVSASSPARIAALRQGVIGGLQLVRTPGNGFERRLTPPQWGALRLQILQHPAIAWPCTLNALELVACLGFPIGSPVLPGVSFGGGRQLPPPSKAVLPLAAGDKPEPRLTGLVTYPGSEGLLVQRPADALRHTYVIGPTGSGKSVVLGGLALADIHAGRGVVVLDMKGDLATDIADRIPEHRLDDVVLLEPGNRCPVGFNVLRSDQPDLTVDTVVHVLSELYARSWGPRTADVMVNGLQTLVKHGGLTLVELPVLLTNPQFRRQVLARVGHDDLGVGPFWQAFESLSDAERATVIGPSLNKLRGFTNREITRRVIGQINGFDLRSIYRERRVFLANLSKGHLGSESAQLLGSLLLGSLWATVQQRAQLPAERRHPVIIYLDEFHELLRLPTDFGDALAQARGLGVGLVMAHQNLDQLTPSLRSAVMANARSKIVFAAGHDDARSLAKVLGCGLTPEDIQGLGLYETYQALCVGGITRSPASARTRPLPTSLGTLSEVRRRSAEGYGRDGEEVDDELRARRRVAPKEVAVGSRKRGGQS